MRNPANSDPVDFSDDQILAPADHPFAVTVDSDRRRAHFLARPYPGVVVFGAVDNDSLPGEFIDLNPCARYRADIADEVAGQLQPVVLDRSDPLLQGVGVHSLLLRVGGQHVRLVARQVRSTEIATQTGRYVDVVDLMTGRVAVDPDYSVLGLAVLGLAQDDARHVQLPR